MKKTMISVLFLLLLVGANSCKKEINSVGIDLRDDLLGTEFSDTTVVQAYSLLEDSLNTTRTHTLLGELRDPVFGQTKASIYMQLALDKPITFTAGVDKFDSVVLILNYTKDYTGDTTQPVTIKVYKLSEDLDNTRTYYHFNTANHEYNNLTHISNFVTYYKPNTRFKVGNDTVYSAPHLRIRLTDALEWDLMKNMSSTDDLRATLKGLYILANSSGSQGCISYFTNNELILYTHRVDTEGKITYSKSIFTTRNKPQTEVTYFTHFDHDYNQSTDMQFKQMVLSGVQSVGEQTLYMQATGGVKTKIKFPHLPDFLKGQNIIINRAELVITNMLPDEVYLKNPNALNLKYIGIDGKIHALADENLGANFFGGTYNKDKQEYRIRITRHVQSILKGVMQNTDFYLTVGSAATNSTRLKFYGTNPAEFSKRLRLEISYTIY